MPVIRVAMIAGRSAGQKREVAEVFTRELARICKCSPEGVTVIFEDVARDDWAVGGSLVSDRTTG